MPTGDGFETMADRASARVGTVINSKWTVDRLLGVGGMGAVYAATHRNNSRAALKVLHPEHSFDPHQRVRFLREGYIANKVCHPGSVQIYDNGFTEDGAAFLVMELLDGEALDALCDRRGGRLPTAEVLAIAEQLLDVLAVAHAAAVVHRDLKPSNLFLTRDGALKVLDFGIARLAEHDVMRTATQTGTLLGTPAFMAPEQARGHREQVSARTDLWAVGATMRTLLTGRVVHEAETANEALLLAMTQPVGSIAAVMPELPRSVVAVVDRALRYAPEERFEDADRMREAVRAARASEADHCGSTTGSPHPFNEDESPAASRRPHEPGSSDAEGTRTAPGWFGSVRGATRPRTNGPRWAALLGAAAAGALGTAGVVAVTHPQAPPGVVPSTEPTMGGPVRTEMDPEPDPATAPTGKPVISPIIDVAKEPPRAPRLAASAIGSAATSRIPPRSTARTPKATRQTISPAAPPPVTPPPPPPSAAGSANPVDPLSRRK
ncbi:MAG: protein kinase [Polyangiaceae bacterium]|nr:protein kinase [Polyangiaceae bacterium]